VCCCHMLRTTPRPSLIYPRSLRRLKRLGWSQDRNIRIDVRYAANCALAPSAPSGSEATVYLPLEIDVGECLPIGIAAFVSSATQGDGKAGVAGGDFAAARALLEHAEELQNPAHRAAYAAITAMIPMRQR
jgi:hypothetical protein